MRVGKALEGKRTGGEVTKPAGQRGRVGNPVNPRVGSGMQQARRLREEEAVEVVRNHEDGTSARLVAARRGSSPERPRGREESPRSGLPQCERRRGDLWTTLKKSLGNEPSEARGAFEDAGHRRDGQAKEPGADSASCRPVHDPAPRTRRRRTPPAGEAKKGPWASLERPTTGERTSERQRPAYAMRHDPRPLVD